MGDVGSDWLASLPDRVASLQEQWRCRVDPKALSGGTEALLLLCIRNNGDLAVIKLGMPGSSDIKSESKVLQLAAGHGYAQV
ncbi:MAG: hypothetical protein CMQ05_00160 [Gammaproteobacteria bacterium]|uniref:Uncharacterized protein n=1 Tax=OM182 bacterium MED-G24 TaxID=1986255 RepID=A0A2A5WUZ7_9GAMM|nr:hypothetical protein [Gammaproteobacteria bacterium]PDH40251.1 MAG: hypothetical protein CNE99_04105 [OM182 bacterium MED-G24]RPG23338.1 MAG: hypothetical protein CBC10_015050 [Gammaproteobacteria bacterium TMED50]